ncbi:unnamed protein product [Closterium sp. Naga37s-1]|nr:unnamed protein product [Closterium sp. Naga37s-1]
MHAWPFRESLPRAPFPSAITAHSPAPYLSDLRRSPHANALSASAGLTQYYATSFMKRSTSDGAGPFRINKRRAVTTSAAGESSPCQRRFAERHAEQGGGGQGALCISLSPSSPSSPSSPRPPAPHHRGFGGLRGGGCHSPGGGHIAERHAEQGGGHIAERHAEQGGGHIAERHAEQGGGHIAERHAEQGGGGQGAHCIPPASSLFSPSPSPRATPSPLPSPPGGLRGGLRGGGCNRQGGGHKPQHHAEQGSGGQGAHCISLCCPLPPVSPSSPSHQVGFEVVDAIARAEGISLSTMQSKAVVGKGRIAYPCGLRGGGCNRQGGGHKPQHHAEQGSGGQGAHCISLCCPLPPVSPSSPSHQVGFEVVDAIARTEGIALSAMQSIARTVMGKGRISYPPAVLSCYHLLSCFPPHQVGFEVVDAIARAEGISLSAMQSKAVVGKGRIAGCPVLLVKPQTFMNLSGESVGPLARFYKIPPERVVAIYDDMDLDVASMKLLAKGGHGGHNGMKSIMQHFQGSRNFPRLRFGIGRPPGCMEAKVYVLQKFSDRERDEVDVAIERAVDAVRLVAAEGMDKAVSTWNLPRRSSANTKA